MSNWADAMAIRDIADALNELLAQHGSDHRVESTPLSVKAGLVVLADVARRRGMAVMQPADTGDQ
ncbi:MAG: hypothetical protein HY701_12735 [Gemmatimonadetes bacterium]|nr:hypothetical protein [Gemmatimonadota bacterium]